MSDESGDLWKYAAAAARDEALARVEAGAGPQFAEQACAFVLSFLAAGPASSETITDECKAAGIVPLRDDRAFGPVYLRLSRAGLIVHEGNCMRRKGHLTAGGNIWRLP